MSVNDTFNFPYEISRIHIFEYNADRISLAECSNGCNSIDGTSEVMLLTV